MNKVYTFGPTFRAEQSFTPRHLAEFWMIEPEIAFADLAADADLAEAFLKYIFRAVLNERPDDMKFFADLSKHMDKGQLAAVKPDDLLAGTATGGAGADSAVAAVTWALIERSRAASAR
jgi:aspartyl/asparaginyl-tRNA synthetase